MSADLDIHVLEGMTPEEYRFSQANCMGSKHFDLRLAIDENDKVVAVGSKLIDTPRITVCELNVGPDDFGELIQQIVGEDLQPITDDLIQQIEGVYHEMLGRSSMDTEVREFLETHKGKPVFTIVW
ncbi:MAG: hypothetical protein HY225_02920 [Candidatus Vogelbacteria bacterium]|nr:hypothetical protein [Candidatus Vogelbacteria bacterium]